MPSSSEAIARTASTTYQTPPLRIAAIRSDLLIFPPRGAALAVHESDRSSAVTHLLMPALASATAWRREGPGRGQNAPWPTIAELLTERCYRRRQAIHCPQQIGSHSSTRLHLWPRANSRATASSAVPQSAGQPLLTSVHREAGETKRLFLRASGACAGEREAEGCRVFELSAK